MRRTPPPRARSSVDPPPRAPVDTDRSAAKGLRVADRVFVDDSHLVGLFVRPYSGAARVKARRRRHRLRRRRIAHAARPPAASHKHPPVVDGRASEAARAHLMGPHAVSADAALPAVHAGWQRRVAGFCSPGSCVAPAIQVLAPNARPSMHLTTLAGSPRRDAPANDWRYRGDCWYRP